MNERTKSLYELFYNYPEEKLREVFDKFSKKQLIEWLIFFCMTNRKAIKIIEETLKKH